MAHDQILTTHNFSSLTIPIITGLAVGISFVVLFALFMNTNGSSQPHFIDKYPHITLSVNGLRDSYSVGESLNFILSARGYDATCTQDPEIVISDAYHVLVWNYQTFNLMGCGDPDLIYPHEITDNWSTDRLVEPLHLNQPGTYTMAVKYYGETIDRQFNVNSLNPTSSPDLDQNGNVDCKKYSEPAAEPSVCLFHRVPDMVLKVAGESSSYYGDKGSFCAPDVCVDAVLIIPEKLKEISWGTEIDFETVDFRQPDQVDVSLWKGVFKPITNDLELSQSIDDNSMFTVDLPDGDYILQVGTQWMKGEYSEMSATYYYKIRVT